jgi:hypothetical protein
MHDSISFSAWLLSKLRTSQMQAIQEDGLRQWMHETAWQKPHSFNHLIRSHSTLKLHIFDSFRNCRIWKWNIFSISQVVVSPLQIITNLLPWYEFHLNEQPDSSVLCFTHISTFILNDWYQISYRCFSSEGSFMQSRLAYSVCKRS